MTEVLGDDSQFINNWFQGTTGGAGTGLYLTGDSILVAINQFTNLTGGIFLDAEDASTPGAASNPSLIANQFCGVSTKVLAASGVTGLTELGSQTCPFSPSGFGQLTCSPAAGLAGSTVVLSGTNLSGATMVLFNGVSAAFTNSAADPDQLIAAIVPDHATTGPVTVLTPQGNITGLTPFTVPVTLAIQSIAPNQVQLSWTADAPGLLLETTTELSGPTWQTVTTSPSIGASQVTWTGPQATSSQFFRLRQP